jgi:hypothetical protein
VTLFPVIYYVSRQRNCCVPDSERENLRTFVYFLLFNGFLSGKEPAARVRYLRDVLQISPGTGLPLDDLLGVIARRQRQHSVTTTIDMLNWHPRLALNIVQPAAARDPLSWQEKAEVDHVFPQSVYRSNHPTMIDDVGNLAYLGKLRNIRKSAEEPAVYFANTPDVELRDALLVDSRSWLSTNNFQHFVEQRRARVLDVAKRFLGH